MPQIEDAQRIVDRMNCYVIPYGHIVPLRIVGDDGGHAKEKEEAAYPIKEVPLPIAARIGETLMICNPFDGLDEPPCAEEMQNIRRTDIELFYNVPEGDLYAYDAVQIGTVIFMIDKTNEFIRIECF